MNSKVSLLVEDSSVAVDKSTGTAGVGSDLAPKRVGAKALLPPRTASRAVVLNFMARELSRASAFDCWCGRERRNNEATSEDPDLRVEPFE